MTKVKAVPEGFHTVTPYLSIEGCSAAIEFYKQAFGAEELVRMPMPGGKVGHAELRIGDSMVMMADVMGDNTKSKTDLMLYVEDCDALFKRAIAAGAKQVKPLTDQFYGDRSGTVSDPSGNCWTIGTHKVDVTPEQMAEHMKKMT